MKAFLLPLFLILFSGPMARAGLLLDLGGGYFSDALNTSSADTSVKYAYNLGVFFNISKEVWGGWSYTGFTTQDTRTGTDTQLVGQDTGPTLKWQFGRSKSFCLGLTYNVLSRATYRTSSASEEWQGTSFNVQFAAMPELKENFRMGIALNYFSASYDRKKVGTTETAVSNSKQWIYPSFMLTKQF